MKQFFAVLSFEYGGYIRSKAFKFTTVLFMALILLASFVPQLYGAFKGAAPRGEKPEAAVVIESENALPAEALAMLRPEALGKAFDAYRWTAEAAESDLEDFIKNEKYSLVLVYGGQEKYALLGNGFDFGLLNALSTLDPYLTQVKQQALLSGMSEAEAAAASLALNASVSGEIRVVSTKSDTDAADATSNYILAYVLIYILFMTIIMYGQFVVNSVVVEKSSKTMELLVTSAGTTALMFGKVFGVGLSALTQLLGIFVAAAVGLTLNLPSWTAEMPAAAAILNQMSLSFDFILVFILFFLTGYFLYAFIYAALGSTVSRIEDASTVVTIPTLLMVFAFVISTIGLHDITAGYVKILSYVPFFTPYIMFSRYAMGEAALSSVAISLVILCLTIVLMGWLAARIYRLGVMMYGKRINPVSILKQSFRR